MTTPQGPYEGRPPSGQPGGAPFGGQGGRPADTPTQALPQQPPHAQQPPRPQQSPYGRPPQGPPPQGPPPQGPPPQGPPPQGPPPQGPPQPGFNPGPPGGPAGPGPFGGAPGGPGAPGGFGPGFGSAEQRPGGGAGKGAGTIWLLGLLSLACVALGVSLQENGRNGWDNDNAWCALAIAGALVTLAPAAAGSIGLGRYRAWQTAVCGASALVLFWVLFVLPSAGSNTSLLTTVGVGAGVLAAWIAPGRDAGPHGPGSGRPGGQHPGTQPGPGHTW